MPERRKKPRDGDPDLRGRRAEPRVRVALPAAAETSAGRQQVKLANISRTGAMLEGPELPALNAQVVLESPSDLKVVATVVWRGGDRCGITFDQRIRDDQVQRLRLAGEWSARTGVLPDVPPASQN